MSSRPASGSQPPASGDAGQERRSIGARYVPIQYAVLGLLATVAALVFSLLLATTPTPRDAGAPATEFAAGRAMPLLERLVGDGAPHPIGSAANASTREVVLAELRAIGLTPATQTAFACVTQYRVCGEVVNVMARLPGQGDGPAVLLTAHYDSVGAGPGVSDDLVGVAAVIETARLLLADGPLRNPFIVLLTDGEEAGLLGAEAFTNHPWFQDVGVVVNVEARGTSGQSLMFETNSDNAWLIDAFARQAPRPVTNSLFYEIYQMLPNDTDFSVYKRAGLNGLNFAYADDVAHYHTPFDDLEHLDRGSLQHHGDNVLAAARALGSSDLVDPPSGNSIYMDLVPGSVLRAPESWATPLAAACLLAWLLMAVALVRRRELTLGRVLLGTVAAVSSVVVAAALGFGVAWSVQAISGLSTPWYATPLPIRIAVWLAALFGAVATSALFSRRLGFWGLAVGTWLLWALLTLATALALPGGSIVFLVPVVIATALFALCLLLGGRRTIGDTIGPTAAGAASVATFAAAYIWLPFALTVELVVGMELSAAVAFCLGLAFITLTPLLAMRRTPSATNTAARRLTMREGLLLACLAGVVVASVLALRAPLFTEQTPQRFTIWHVQEVGADGPVGASWLLDRNPDGPLPAAFDAFSSSGSTAHLPTSYSGYLYTDAPTRSVAPPAITVTSDVTTGSGRVVRVRLDAGDDRDWLTLSIDRSAGPTRLLIPGTDYQMSMITATSEREGLVDFTCMGPTCAGLEVELHLERQGLFELVLQAHSYGLPETATAHLNARPSTAAPSQTGDASVVFTRLLVP